MHFMCGSAAQCCPLMVKNRLVESFSFCGYIYISNISACKSDAQAQFLRDIRNDMTTDSLSL